MAVPTNTYTRYTAATNVREDLADFIARQDPKPRQSFPAQARPRPRRRCMSGTATPCAHPMPTTRPLTATTHRHRQRPLPTELATTAKSSRTRSLCRVAPRWWTRQA